MLGILLATSLFFSAMSEEELDQTGLTKLTIQERVNLQDWLEEHYEKKLSKNKKNTNPVIEEVVSAGKFVRLSDDTYWEIDPENTLITRSWITPAEIKITKTENKDYPYTLTNTLTGSTVSAKKAKGE